jgi:hypothetical protein
MRTSNDATPTCLIQIIAMQRQRTQPKHVLAVPKTQRAMPAAPLAREQRRFSPPETLAVRPADLVGSQVRGPRTFSRRWLTARPRGGWRG